MRCVMNKTIKNMMVAGLACLAMCGSAMAAPKGAPSHKSNGPAPRQTIQTSHKTAPKAAPKASKHNEVRKHEASRPHDKVYVAKHRATPPAPKRPPEPCHRHHRHEYNDCHYNEHGWIELGAGLIGGLIGSIIAG